MQHFDPFCAQLISHHPTPALAESRTSKAWFDLGKLSALGECEPVVEAVQEMRRVNRQQGNIYLHRYNKSIY